MVAPRPTKGVAFHISGTSLGLLLLAVRTCSSPGGLSRTRTPDACHQHHCPEPFSNSFMTYEQISWYLKSLSDHNIKTDLIEKLRSEKNRTIFVVRIRPYMTSNPVNPRPRPDRPSYFVEAGLDGSSWLSTSTALHLIHELSHHSCTKGCDQNYYIVPLANPDGYEYARNLDNTWTKTRSIETRGCFGIVMNHNFPSVLNTTVCGSVDPCSGTFRGEAASSATEVRELVSLKYSISNMKLSLTIEGKGEPSLMYPQKSSKKHKPIAQAYCAASKNAADQIQMKAYGDVHGCEGGTSMHFTHSANISPLAFSLVQRDGTADDIMEEVKRTYDGIRAMTSEMEKIYKVQTKTVKSS